MLTHNGKPTYVGLWDTAGQEDYDRLRPLSYPQTDAFLLVFSITNRSSFLNLSKWLTEVRAHCGHEVCVLLVGNKLDLDAMRQVKEAEARDFAQANGMAGFFEVSALTAQGVREVLLEAVDFGVNKDKKTAMRRAAAAAQVSAEQDSVFCLAYASDGKEEELFTGTRRGAILVWDVKRGGPSKQCLVQHTSQVYSLSYQCHNRTPLLVSTSKDFSVCVWQKKVCWRLASVVRHRDQVYAHAFISPSLFAACGLDKTVKVWQISFPQEAEDDELAQISLSQDLDGAEAGGCNCLTELRLHQEQVVVVAGCANGTLLAWNLTRDGGGKLLARTPLDAHAHPESISHVDSVKGEGMIVCSTSLGAIETWRLDTKDKGVTFDLVLVQRLTSIHSDAINFQVVCGDGLCCFASRDGTCSVLRLRRLVEEDAVATLDVMASKLRGHNKSTTRACDLAVLSDAVVLVVAAGKDKTVRCFNANTGQLVWHRDGHADFINRVLVIEKERVVVTADRSGVCLLWELETGRLVHCFTQSSATRFQLEVKTPYVDTALEVVVIAAEFFQYVAFPLPGFTAAAPPPALITWLQSFAPMLQGSVLVLPSAEYQFWLAWSFALLVRVLIHTAFAVKRNPSRWLVFEVYCLVVWASASILLIPLVRSLLVPVSTTGAMMAGLAVPVLLWHVVETMRLVSVGGDLRKIALYFHGTWRFDWAGKQNTGWFAKRSVVFAQAQVVGAVGLVCVGVFVKEDKILYATCLLLWALLAVQLACPPYWCARANAGRAAVWGAVCWVAVAGAAAMGDDDDATLLYVGLVLCPLTCAGLGYWRSVCLARAYSAPEP